MGNNKASVSIEKIEPETQIRLGVSMVKNKYNLYHCYGLLTGAANFNWILQTHTHVNYTWCGASVATKKSKETCQVPTTHRSALCHGS